MMSAQKKKHFGQLDTLTTGTKVHKKIDKVKMQTRIVAKPLDPARAEGNRICPRCI